MSHTKIARTIGETLVSACPDTSRVEQRLGQIQEYIRVTASLVDSMRNSEDEVNLFIIQISLYSTISKNIHFGFILIFYQIYSRFNICICSYETDLRHCVAVIYC